MSLSINTDPSARTSSANNDDDSKKSADAQKKPERREFDFAGAAYTSTHLPSGMIGARPTKATLTADAYDVAAKGSKIAQDLKSPELRELLEASGAVGIDAVKVLQETYDLSMAAPKAVEGDIMSIGNAIKAAAGLVKDSVSLCLDAQRLKKADTPQAQEKLRELLHDIGALETSNLKFSSDARKFALGV